MQTMSHGARVALQGDAKDSSGFFWTCPRLFCKVNNGARNERVIHHASDHRWRSFVLWPGGEAGGTRSDSADHARFCHAEPDRAIAHGLRTAGVAPPKRWTQKPGMLLFLAGTARTWVASLVVHTTQEAAPALD